MIIDTITHKTSMNSIVNNQNKASPLFIKIATIILVLASIDIKIYNLSKWYLEVIC